MMILALYVAAGLLLLAWLAYRQLLPRPLPGLWYNRETAETIMGDAKQLMSDWAETGETWTHRFAWTRKIGVPIYQAFLQPGHSPWVVLDEPREIQDIAMRRNRDFDRQSGNTNAFYVVMPNSTIAQSTTPTFKAQRRQWQDTMRPEFLHSTVVPNIGVAALDLVDLWKLKAAKAGGEPIDVKHDFSVAALDAIWVAILGERLGLTRAKMAEFEKTGQMSSERVGEGIDMEATMDFLNMVVENFRGSIFAWFSAWRMKRDPKFKRFNSMKDESINRLIRNATARYQRILDGNTEGDEHDTCAMDLVLRRQLLAAQKAGQPAPDATKDKGLCDELFLLLWAGHDTTSVSLSWFVKYVSNAIEAQDKLRAAILKALPGRTMPSAADIMRAEIPYLDGAIEETLRMSSTASAIVRVSRTDTEILGHKVPGGTTLLMSTTVLARPPPVPEHVRSPTSRAARDKRSEDWVNEPAADHLEEFAPDRWLKRGEGGEEVFDPATLPQNAFGHGARGCFGRRLAMLELRIIIVHIIWHFKLLPLPEEHNSMRANQGLLRKAAQCHVRLEPVQT